MHIFIGAVVVGFISMAVMFARRHGDTAGERAALGNWQLYSLVFLSAPAVIAGADGLISHYLVSGSRLSDVGLACAWAAVISNSVLFAILYSVSRRKSLPKEKRFAAAVLDLDIVNSRR